MRSPRQLPTSLRRRAFTRAQLRASGIHPDRLRRSDIVPLGAGTYAHLDLIDGADDALLTRLRALALAKEFSHAWLSHGTAAALLDRCAVPANCLDGQVHLSVPAKADAITRSGVRCHRVHAAGDEVRSAPGLPDLRVSAPARIWRELAPMCDPAELVALGDSLVREPYFWAERRSEPHAHIEELRTAAERAGAFRGKRIAEQALPLIRIGADSAQESAFRLALMRAGLPEPQLQIPLDPTNPRSRRGDMGYQHWKLVIQYDGAHHYTPQQHRKDQQRDNEWAVHGWVPLRVNIDDARNGFGTAVRQVRTALFSRGFTDGMHT